jgi:MoxR-like ATPase
MTLSLEDFRRRAAAIQTEVAKVIVGQEEVVRHTLIAILCGGHVLLEGVPGLGKTALIRTLGQALDLRFSRIQFTPDLMPADILGVQMLVETEAGRSLRFQPGPIFANLVLADEINRATPKTQSALLEAMQEGSVTVANTTHRLDAPFFVLATQNPLEMEGTYPLPEAQLDRFFFKVNVPFPSAADLVTILERTTGGATATLSPVVDAAELIEMRERVRSTPIPAQVTDFVARLISASHPGDPAAPEIVRRTVRAGASPRAAQALILGAKAAALLDGRYNAAFADVLDLAPAAMRHRLLLNFDGLAEGVTPDELIAALTAAVPVLAA